MGSASQTTGATVQLEVNEGNNPVTARLTYRSSGDATDQVAVQLEVVDGAPSAYIVRTLEVTPPGSGCAGTIDPRVLRCPLPPGAVPVGPDVRVGGGHDRVAVSPSLHAGAVLSGGLGNDRLRGGQHLIGGPGDDTLVAATASGSHLDGGSGADQLQGWVGDDVIVAGPGWDRVDASSGDDRIVAWRDGRDHVLCGHGVDIVRADGVDLLDPNSWDGDHPGPDVCDRIVRSTPARAVAGTMIDPTELAVRCPRDLPHGCLVDARVSVPNGFVVWAMEGRRIQAGRTALVAWYHHRHPSRVKTILITYPRSGQPRKAVAIFHFTYEQEG